MKYFVNETCIGYGMCCGICPAIFHMNDAGAAEAAEQEVDAENLANAQEAMENCPVSAIEER